MMFCSTPISGEERPPDSNSAPALPPRLEKMEPLTSGQLAIFIQEYLSCLLVWQPYMQFQPELKLQATHYKR